MKKVVLGLSVLAMIGGASCKKDEKKKVNTWTLGGTEYSVVSAYSTDGSMVVVDPSATTCSFDFEGTNAPAAGTYKVVASKSGVGAGVGEVVIYASKSGTGGIGYASTNAATKSATVTVNSGKITVSVPEITLLNMSGGTDEITFSANEITQTN